jgi:flagellar basal-body rod modification protein FlgD
MADIGATMNPLLKQNSAEQFKTEMQVDTLNKTLKKDGREPVKVMGKDEFLKLLVTQLQHQDPTKPMEDREFIAQMAQFSSLEQMLNMNNSMEKFVSNLSFQGSYDLLGREVSVETLGADGEMGVVSGTVDAVSRNETGAMVTINGQKYPISSVTRVAR